MTKTTRSVNQAHKTVNVLPDALNDKNYEQARSEIQKMIAGGNDVAVFNAIDMGGIKSACTCLKMAK